MADFDRKKIQSATANGLVRLGLGGVSDQLATAGNHVAHPRVNLYCQSVQYIQYILYIHCTYAVYAVYSYREERPTEQVQKGENIPSHNTVTR